MPRKKKPPLSFVEMMRKLKSSGIGDRKIAEQNGLEEIDSLDDRIRHILGTIGKQNIRGRMIFFVMYDIESNKVRNLVVKYLQKNGCYRVQKSIFLANTTVEAYNMIRSDLEDVQAVYENQDSIIILPVTTDYLNMMKVIGKNVNIDIMTHSKNTLFF